MPPSIPIPDLIQSIQKVDDESSGTEVINLESQKQHVLEILNNEVDKIDGTIKASVKTKLTSFDDDWNQCDNELKKFLIDLTECELSLLNIHRT